MFSINRVFPLVVCFDHVSHSDNNLVELGNEVAKEDDRTVLMEGGLSKTTSQKSASFSIKSNLIRQLSQSYASLNLGPRFSSFLPF